jgi:glycosyltransferase involved in cell wall biosynthesis
MKKIIFINSHPIQYFAPLYKFLNEQGIKTNAWYCSDISVTGGHDKGFGVGVKWDIPLLEGYENRFFRNYSWKPSPSNGFWGLLNPGMITELFRIPKSVIVVHGWNYFTHLSVLLLGKLKGHTVCLRCEMPQNQELLKKGWKQEIKRMGLKYLLFPRVNYFLYIGRQNRLFYKSYGISDDRLLFCPYSVDDDRFRKDWEKFSPHKAAIKQKLGIPGQDKIILYSGKYIRKKRPMDILRAFIQLNEPHCWLIMVGEGELRREMESLIQEHGVTRILLTGFINQSMISEYYAVSDVFVMCSETGETWGLSVNEAMNFNLPVIVSDITGCSQDLVEEGINGYVFTTGNIQELAAKLYQVLIENKLLWSNTSRNIIEKYSYSVIRENIQTIL